MDAQPARQMYLGPIKLAPGVTPREVITFLVVVAIAGVMVSLLTLLQPLIFSDILHVPAKQQGRLGGALASVQQLMVLIFISLAGALSDRWGRKYMLVLALTGFSIAAVFFPLVSSVAMLFVVRAFFGLSQNGHTAGGPIKMFDYPDNASRGKFMAMTMVCLNLATIVLVGMTGSHLPAWLSASGLSMLGAVHGSFWIIAAVGVAAALLGLFGLQKDRRPRAAGAPRQGVKDFLKGFGDVYRHALGNPGFATLMITGFVIRTDTTVLQSFVSLWVVNAGHAQGISTLQGLKTAGALTGIQAVTFLIVPVILGILLDRVNRLVGYTCAMGFAGLALMSTMFVHNITAWPIFVVMGVIGVGEAAQTITQQALFGQEAPPHLRGTAYGIFAFTGTFSVVLMTAVSGVLFDKIGYTAPFVLAGALHICFLAIALLFMLTQHRRRAARAAMASA